MPVDSPDHAGAVRGGCQCGAVRYAITGSRESWHANVCHCRMCQKAGGGPFMAFVNVPRTSLDWTAGERGLFASSSIASRGFCRACGTPLTYERTAERISVSIGSLDEAGVLAPDSQLTGDHVLAWSTRVGDLPAVPLASWLAKLPEPITSHQHPDRNG